MIDLHAIESDVVALCREVGEFILYESKKFSADAIEQKEGFNNLVSYVDKQAEIKLVQRLQQLIPDAGFITEEGTISKKSEAYNWIIDPLDGTTNFIHGVPVYAISIGLSYQQEMVLGVIHDITRDECYHASKGRQSQCNNAVINVSKVKTLSESLFATGFPYYYFDKRDSYLEIIKDFLSKTHGIRRFGSAAIDLAYVSRGRLEGFFEYNLNAWDVAAGTFLVQQAGGIVTDFNGKNNFIFGGELCAGCAVQPEMLSVIKHHWWT